MTSFLFEYTLNAKQRQKDLKAALQGLELTNREQHYVDGIARNVIAFSDINDYVKKEQLRPEVMAALKKFKEEMPPYEQAIENPEFKKWFEGSKCVDSSGMPLLLFHGSKKKNIKQFNTRDEEWESNPDVREQDSYIAGRDGSVSSPNNKKKNRATGLWLTTNHKLAKGYSDDYKVVNGEFGVRTFGDTYPLFMKCVNPLIVDAHGDYWYNAGVRTPGLGFIPDDGWYGMDANGNSKTDYQWDTQEEQEAALKKKKVAKILPNFKQEPYDRTRNVYRARSTDQVARYARSQGYDAVCIKNVLEDTNSGEVDDWVAFKPDQVRNLFDFVA